MLFFYKSAVTNRFLFRCYSNVCYVIGDARLSDDFDGQSSASVIRFYDARPASYRIKARDAEVTIFRSQIPRRSQKKRKDFILAPMPLLHRHWQG